ncbi:FKBP-type peptidyl-prolyl cis-trans isomerase [Rickettsiales bacterium Ac37b]|nr:FKBP-type peptidyl-prolyl cis-trans isomerase [Rickettsiales bacterium Ac37b]
MPGNKIISVAIILFIIYAIANDKNAQSKINSLFNSSKHTETNTPHATPDNVSTIDNPTFSNITITPPANNDSVITRFLANTLNNVVSTKEGQEAIKKIITTVPNAPIIPREFQEFSIVDDKIGKGHNIECGQKLAINYQILSAENKILASNLDQTHPSEIIVGNNDIVKAMDFVALGMKEGGSRKAILSPYFIENDIKFKEKAQNYNGFSTLIINVIESSTLPSSKGKLRIFTERLEEGEPAKCGDNVNIHYKILRLDGTEIFNSAKAYPKAINVKVGSDQVPFAINKIIEYMTINSEKVAIVPPEFLNNIFSKKTDNFFLPDLSLPTNEMVILEVTRV